MFEKMLTQDTKIYQFSSYHENAKEQYQKDFNIKNISHFYNHWIKTNEKYYYYKYQSATFQLNLLNELNGEALCDYMKLNTVHYMIGYDIDMECPTLLSETFRKKGKEYVTIMELPYLKYIDTYDIFDELAQLNDKKIQVQFLEQLKKMIVLDFYMGQTDRHEDNYLFEKNDDGYLLAPLFDFESSFHHFNTYGNNFFACDLWNREQQKMIYQDKTFQKLFEQVYHINMKKILNQIEMKNHLKIPKEIKDIYIDYQQEMQKKMKQKKLI